MLIAHQKFRSHMLGHYNRSCHIIMHNTCETWGLIYLRTMRTVPMSCHMLLHMQCCRVHIAQCAHAGKLATLSICGLPGITYGQYLSKITASHFSTLNMKIANQNMLKMIPIAMHNENKADCNENFRICAEEPIAPLYKQ